MQRVSHTGRLLAALLSLLAFEVRAQTPTQPQKLLSLQDEASNMLLEPPEFGAAQTYQSGCFGRRPERNGVDVTYQLQINRSTHKIYNPSSGALDTVDLRTYNNCLTGPTIRVQPGDRLHLNLKNELDAADPTCPKTLTDHNDPNCFNSGNIHVHGLHVSPAGNSDNVLLSIAPQTSFDYQYDIPPDHPAGTFWYHSHRHGSTALSVSSGMEGAIIIKGDRRVEDKARNGIADIDTILRQNGTPIRERILMFQQIGYGCFTNGKIPPYNLPPNNPAQGTASYQPRQDDTGAWECNSGEVGVVENYPTQFGFEVIPGHGAGSVWPISHRPTEINGKVAPTVVVTQPGRIERWRLIDAGVRDTISVAVVKVKQSTNTPQVVSQALSGIRAGQANLLSNRQLVPVEQHALQTFADQTCDQTQTLKQFEFAVDGLTRDKIAALDFNVLQPGYRSDVLMTFPEPGLYCVIDTQVTGDATIIPAGQRLEPKQNKLLAIVEVDGHGTVSADLNYITDQIVKANPSLPGPVRTALAQSDISAYAPHASLLNAHVDATPFVDFSFVLFNSTNGAFSTPTIPQTPPPVQGVLLGQAAIQSTAAAAKALVFPATPTTPAQLASLPNAATYDPSIVNWTAQLNQVDQWTITSDNAAHVFHIHVNPFQIVDILAPGANGASPQSIFQPAGCTELTGSTPDPQYCNQQHVFRDTIFIKPGYQIVMKTQYKDYVGEFVIHCHILDHEDQGMMQNISIIPATGGQNAGDMSARMSKM